MQLSDGRPAIGGLRVEAISGSGGGYYEAGQQGVIVNVRSVDEPVVRWDHSGQERQSNRSDLRSLMQLSDGRPPLVGTVVEANCDSNYGHYKAWQQGVIVRNEHDPVVRWDHSTQEWPSNRAKLRSLLPSEVTTSLRFCSYNIYEGLKDWNPVRVDALKRWLCSQQLDLVGLQEGNHLTPERLQSLGAASGLPYVHLQTTTSGYHLGILSRYPLKVCDTRVLSAQLRHGLLHATLVVQGVTWNVLVTHLTPGTTSMRREETRQIATYALTSAEPREQPGPLLLMGDFNALSTHDESAHHHRTLLRDVLLPSRRLRDKFTTSGAIDYGALAALYDAGFSDPGRPLVAEERARQLEAPRDEDSCSVPTPVNDDPAHAAAMRLDYILLAPSVPSGARARTIRDELTRQISDHYPVVVSVERPGVVSVERNGGGTGGGGNTAANDDDLSVGMCLLAALVGLLWWLYRRWSGDDTVS